MFYHHTPTGFKLNIALMTLLWEKLKSSSTLATGYFLNKTVVESFNLF